MIFVTKLVSRNYVYDKTQRHRRAALFRNKEDKDQVEFGSKICKGVEQSDLAIVLAWKNSTPELPPGLWNLEKFHVRASS